MFENLKENLFCNICLVMCFFYLTHAFGQTESSHWSVLDSVLQSRVKQHHQKMKLQVEDAEQFKVFLRGLHDPLPHLNQLQHVLPKTTVELLMAVNKRGLELKEAEKMAEYLKGVVDEFRFSNPSAFDENTSHIIGREWSEIDYSGEGMTWQKQKAKYQPFGIEHFKSLENLERFIPVESKLPYFNKIYKPNWQTVTPKR